MELPVRETLIIIVHSREMALLELATAASLAHVDEEDPAENGGGDLPFGYYRKQRTSHTAHQKSVMAKCALSGDKRSQEGEKSPCLPAILRTVACTAHERGIVRP